MAFLIYNLIILFLSPAIVIFILWRILVTKKSAYSWRDQLGFVRLPDLPSDKPRIWIHAVSVGESVAGAGVVAQLKRIVSEAVVIVSTTTHTGQEMARKCIAGADAFFYYPFDLLPSVELAVSRTRPSVFASIDTEIWPNLRHVLRRRGIPNAVINGTVSDKTMRGARLLPWLYRWTFSNIDLFCMQSAEDAERIIALGADPSRVRVTGNCKADEAEGPLSDEDRSKLRESLKLPADARVVVAGSTNPGEDQPVLEAFAAARRVYPDLRLIVAPRQIERKREIRELALGLGLSCGFRSQPETVTGNEDVIVLDTFGELSRVYAIADAAFVGGSLIRKGGHSILQPISQGKPVLFGPHTFKQRDIVNQAKRAGVGFEVSDAQSLAGELVRLLGDRQLLDGIGRRCAELIAANAGASIRTAEALADLLRRTQH
ncbi:MAG: 3-deoxy-D-manno-octulosonic acid transferase [Armatimonadota bacterium]|nr:3-deoxy-D-manno-octulosonic acid transferase [Armatimonadota bacterium]